MRRGALHSAVSARCVLGLLVLVGGVLSACSNEGTIPEDGIVPSRITDLAVADVDDSTVTLTWTAPGDDGSAGIVARYEIRWLNTPVADPDWESATSVGPVPIPLPAGQTQIALVRGIPSGQRRYLAVKSFDDAENVSVVSNSVFATTGPPVCRLEPDTVHFGATTVATPYDVQVAITNVGGGTLSGTIPSICGPFTVTTGGGTLRLRAEGTQTLTVRFLPPTPGPFECALPTGSPCQAIVLRGSGVEPQPILLIEIPPGTYRRGSPPSEPGRDPEDERAHEVTLTASFLICANEVTQGEWLSVMRWNESQFDGADRPVENVTWYDALEYCNRRSLADGLVPVYDLAEVSRDGVHIISAEVFWNSAHSGYRLPTEGEWEYACRAGGEQGFFSGEITQLRCTPPDPALDPVGWFCGNSLDQTQPVARKEPNGFGLHDVHGNVFEWCWDWYDPDYGLSFPPDPEDPYAVTNPLGPVEGSSRICRGGSWRVNPQECRSAFRFFHSPGQFYADVGLRIARNL